MRAVYQRTKQQQASFEKGIKTPWKMSLASFQKRLRWHCHFMQKLEDQPNIEFENFNRGFDGLRMDFNENYFLAWQKGETGYPLIDACMRCLKETGWINFRMRAMLASFSSYHLWLHWQKPAVYLAKHFLDFEPGIHFSQFQMQSGTTGINSIRIYSPIKQVADHDSQGKFIRKWIPELANVPDFLIAEPHKMTLIDQKQFGCVLDKDYPLPVVDHKKAYSEAKEKIFKWKSKQEVKQEAKMV